MSVKLFSVAYSNSQSGLLGIVPTNAPDCAFIATCRQKSVGYTDYFRIPRKTTGCFDSDLFDLRVAYRARLRMEAERNRLLIRDGVSPRIIDQVAEYPSLWLTRIVIDSANRLAQVAIRCNPDKVDYLVHRSALLREFRGNTRSLVKGGVLARKLSLENWYTVTAECSHLPELIRFRSDLMDSPFSTIRVSKLFEGLEFSY